MLLTPEIEFDATLKRGFISNEDRDAVFKDRETGYYAIKSSSATFERGYIANFYHQSSIYSRIMARIAVDVDLLVCGEYVRMHDRLVGGDVSAWLELSATHDLKAYGRLSRKCYTYIKSTGDCFGLLPGLKSYCMLILGKHEAEVQPYLECTTSRDDYSIERLFSTQAFQELEEGQVAGWVAYLTEYTKGIKYIDKLLAIRDHAADLGGDYDFLKKACVELLL